ncbi:MAG TPA: phosphate acyltransferase PlsX [Solirubrobacteraceae bacterium]|jgi:glycerol-3-phosphate acyltransferase PlsX
MTPTIAVDANGADLGPREVAEGAIAAAATGVHVRLFGPAGEIGDVPDGVEVVDAPVSIAKAPDPVSAVRSTPEASIVQAARAVGAGEADALVSAGSTGAALAAGLFNIKRAKGVYRPALAAPMPVPDHPVTLIDVGANAEVRPDHLVQFAFMGASVVRLLDGIERPRVGLMSNGEEASRGTQLVRQAHELLVARTAGSTALEFIGNVEGMDVTSGRADVIVMDGFTGNVTLKVMEGVSQRVLAAIKDRAMASTRAKAGGLLMRPALGGLRDSMDPEGAGGAYLLGLRRLGIVPHGRFSRRGFATAIRLAARAVSDDLVGRTHADLEAAGALRGPASEATTTVSA